ncbi:invasion associated locus B family protein [Maritimibacter fusiformis]|uniref:Invasion associated locus B (IalB) protein n=1 Tax=Maritimibacter fusiformis TaxID=2603819 RepID=A0A5D0R7L0_9RHOB|nr:invasion associated locus B family protein [Maritimibacter fusiformis]TYB77640.1 hypothetical protein FVF75_15370 [Maritimibacter fusiformis]
MKSNIALGLCTAALIWAATGATAQDESDNRVAANTDWSVFVEASPKECWSVSKPKETVNTKDGRPVAVSRGDILMFVSYRPEAGVSGEVSFTGGYPFKPESVVTVTIGSDTFQLFTDGEWAWSSGPEDDAKIIAAMKRGADAIVVGVSSRGTRTEDKFSLLGFTAAVEDAAARCK